MSAPLGGGAASGPTTGAMKFAGSPLGVYITNADAVRWAWALRRLYEVVDRALVASETGARFDVAVAAGVDLADIAELGRALAAASEATLPPATRVQWVHGAIDAITLGELAKLATGGRNQSCVDQAR